MQYLIIVYTFKQATIEKSKNIKNNKKRKNILACSRVKLIQNYKDTILFDKSILQEKMLF